MCIKGCGQGGQVSQFCLQFQSVNIMNKVLVFFLSIATSSLILTVKSMPSPIPFNFTPINAQNKFHHFLSFFGLEKPVRLCWVLHIRLRPPKSITNKKVSEIRQRDSFVSPFLWRQHNESSPPRLGCHLPAVYCIGKMRRRDPI